MNVFRTSLVLSVLLSLGLAPGVRAEQVSPAVAADRSGKLVYAEDADHNRVPDFSHAGYRGGGERLPEVPAKVALASIPGDNTARIQAALDSVAALAADANGFRGAVVLSSGRYEIAGQLRIVADGIVLRGAGPGADGTVLVATGWDRRALIAVRGAVARLKAVGDPASDPFLATRSRAARTVGTECVVAEARVPVGATTLRLKSTAGLKVGAEVVIRRPGTKEWVHALGMDVAPARQQFAWKAPAVDLEWDRVVTAIDGDTVTVDAPLTTALEANYGGGTIAPTTSPGRLNRIGIEALRCESAIDSANPLDEQHAWDAIALDGVRDAWVSDVTAVHFAGSAVIIGAAAARITVQDCVSLAPVSELGGYRRHTFHTSGQQTLFLRCRSEEGRADFTAGYLAAGPNVFLECTADRSLGTSGSVGSWASGMLFDNVILDGGTLALDNRETWNQGVGWAAANSMLWQCSAPVVICRRPPTAQNWADGVWGQFVGDGWWSQVNEFIHPQSLYRAQLAERKGEGALAALSPRKYPEIGMPTTTLPANPASGPAIENRQLIIENGLALRHGWLVAGDRLLAGTTADTDFWRGYLLPGREDQPSHLTRFAPGLTGPIHTAELAEMADGMVAAGQVVVRHHWGLWYDRRRMDHERMRRPDGDVWPPFFEQPWARSGQGAAWDGLSRYDLTKFNPWYFGRLRQFAALGREKGLVLINAMYFQHNILEAGAHWVDFPWRPTNCLQPTGFTEPPPFTGDTVKMAAEFYDLSHSLRRDLHRRFIRHSLEALADEPNVIHVIGAEYSGPRHFMEFWVDTVAEWERETGKRPLIGLSACKDVQEAILADPVRAAVIDVIDLKYWFRTDDGAEFAPAGGTDLAPRQHERKWKKAPIAASIAGMVAEYRRRFPDKAVIADLREADGWAFAAAGGSLPKLPATTEPRLLAALAKMKPVAGAAHEFWVLADGEAQFFAYAAHGGGIDLRTTAGTWTVLAVDLKTGAVTDTGKTVAGGKVVTVGESGRQPAAYWLLRTP